MAHVPRRRALTALPQAAFNLAEGESNCARLVAEGVLEALSGLCQPLSQHRLRLRAR